MKRLLLFLVRFYQRAISPRKGGSCCKYIPTCSNYAHVGMYLQQEPPTCSNYSLLAIGRILRCNPFSRGGYDPVPEKKSRRLPR